jgi:uncharacterized membrane protein YqjE
VADVDANSPANIAAAIAEVSEKAQLLIREEIELAKTEVTEKVTKLIKGAVVGLAAGVFVLLGLMMGLHGLAWLAYWVIPFPNGTYFWGFFVVAVALFLMGGLAGYLAFRFFRGGSPPTPVMAIGEAKAIKETISPSNADSSA